MCVLLFKYSILLHHDIENFLSKSETNTNMYKLALTMTTAEKTVELARWRSNSIPESSVGFSCIRYQLHYWIRVRYKSWNVKPHAREPDANHTFHTHFIPGNEIAVYGYLHAKQKLKRVKLVWLDALSTLYFVQHIYLDSTALSQRFLERFFFN